MNATADPERSIPQVIDHTLDWADYRGDRARLGAGLAAYADWLSTEALQAGGIGPVEPPRLWQRHLADSLTYLAALESPGPLIDVGSGAGLPGIPLALARPDWSVTLLDRSERRCWLARRAVRILGLDNVEVLCGDAHIDTFPQVTAISRAVESVADFATTARRMLPAGRLAVVAGAGECPDAGPAVDFIRIPLDLLDRPGWLAKISLPKIPLCGEPELSSQP